MSPLGGAARRLARPQRPRIGTMEAMRDRLAASRTPLALIAVALCVSGALVLTFSAWEARGLIGWGLVLLGVVSLTAGIAARKSDQR